MNSNILRTTNWFNRTKISILFRDSISNISWSSWLITLAAWSVNNWNFSSIASDWRSTNRPWPFSPSNTRNSTCITSMRSTASWSNCWPSENLLRRKKNSSTSTVYPNICSTYRRVYWTRRTWKEIPRPCSNSGTIKNRWDSIASVRVIIQVTISILLTIESFVNSYILPFSSWISE